VGELVEDEQRHLRALPILHASARREFPIELLLARDGAYQWVELLAGIPEAALVHNHGVGAPKHDDPEIGVVLVARGLHEQGIRFAPAVPAADDGHIGRGAEHVHLKPGLRVETGARSVATRLRGLAMRILPAIVGHVNIGLRASRQILAVGGVVDLLRGVAAVQLQHFVIEMRYWT
jgi:hypothetical protein